MTKDKANQIRGIVAKIPPDAGRYVVVQLASGSSDPPEVRAIYDDRRLAKTLALRLQNIASPSAFVVERRDTGDVIYNIAEMWVLD